MDLTRITVFCFTASYAVALSLEAVSVARRFGLHRPVLLGFASAGLFAHVAYLLTQARAEAPLSSPADWCLLAALVLAGVYAASTFLSPRHATGLFLLPAVLGLIALSHGVSSEPIAVERASAFWGSVHSWSLILATVTVTLGFLAGLMYLIQSWRLKQKLPPASGFRLPTLESLERVNGRALGFSAWLVAAGFLSGLVLTRIARGQGAEAAHGMWTDPVVISLSVMFGWLVAVEVFRFVYPAARGGRKVAYLTVASFIFLVITLASMTLVRPSGAGGNPNDSAAGPSGLTGPAIRPAVVALPTGGAPTKQELLRGAIRASNRLGVGAQKASTAWRPSA
ncbi:MAG: cytochrome C assembly protein [Planctomycetota bacterium]